MKKNAQKEMDAQIIFESPLSNMKGNWLGLMQSQYLNCGQALLQDNGNSRVAFESSVLFLISLIPNKERRDEILQYREDEIEAAIKKAKKENNETFSNSDKNDITHRINIKIGGLVSDYVDTFLGIHQKLTYDVIGVE